MGSASRKGGRKAFVDQKDSALALALSVATASEEKAEAKASKIQRPSSSTEPKAKARGPKTRKGQKSRGRAKLEAAKALLIDRRKDKARARKDGRRHLDSTSNKNKGEPKETDKPPKKRVAFA